MRSGIIFCMLLAVQSIAIASDPSPQSTKPPVTKDEAVTPAVAKEDPKTNKEVKSSKEKLIDPARLKEAQATDDLAAKIADKLAMIRKEKEEQNKINPGRSNTHSYAPPLKKQTQPSVERIKRTNSGSNSTHWSYDGTEGPQYWGKLSAANVKCDIGDRQSPIDIRDGIQVELDTITYDYKSVQFNVLDNGHTIQVELATGNYISVSGKTYELVQFHFHRPSEERVNGKSFEMVAHLVHKDREGKLAVVAILIQSGKMHPVVQLVLNNLPLEKNDLVKAQQDINVSRMVPAKHDYFTYMGSLTTPPCTEGVLWIVLKEPIEMAPDQLAIFARLYPMNARPLQRTAGRIIKESK